MAILAFQSGRERGRVAEGEWGQGRGDFMARVITGFVPLAGVVLAYSCGGVTSLTMAPFVSLRTSTASFWTRPSSAGLSIW